MSKLEIDDNNATARLEFHVPTRDRGLARWLGTMIYSGIGLGVAGAILYTSYWQACGPEPVFPYALLAFLPFGALWGPWLRGWTRALRRGYSIKVLYCRGLCVVAIGDGEFVGQMQHHAFLREMDNAVWFQGKPFRYFWLNSEQQIALRAYIQHHRNKVFE